MNCTLVRPNPVSKFVPMTVTVVPVAPMVGVKLLMVGALSEAPPARKLVPLVALPSGEVTLIGPVVTPIGAVTTNLLEVAELTVAPSPLNLTVFALAVALNPVPVIVTPVPFVPVCGVKSIIETLLAPGRLMAMMLPTAS